VLAIELNREGCEHTVSRVAGKALVPRWCDGHWGLLDSTNSYSACFFLEPIPFMRIV
jgi:hypothetical protein